MDLNVKAPFTLTRAALPLLDAASTPEDPGRVINIGSVAGIMPQPIPSYAYDASKAAIHMLTRKLSSELADRRKEGGNRITVNAIAPYGHALVVGFVLWCVSHVVLALNTTGGLFQAT